MTLSNLKVEKLKQELKSKKYADSDGLYLHIFPNGSKHWRFRYRHLGKENILSLGTYPGVSLLEARQKKNEARKLLQAGKDPNIVKREEERIIRYHTANTFRAVAQEWFDLNKDSWTPKYSSKVWRRFENYAFPVIGSRPINEVSGLEILNDIIRPLERKNKTETSHKLLQNCAAVFRLAFITKRVSYNPLADLRGVLKPHRAKHLPTIRIEELPAFLARLEGAKANQLYKLAIRLLILTFVRQGELRKAKWAHFNFEKGLWYIPAELMKMRKEHVVPLSRQALEILHQVREISGQGEYLFPPVNRIRHPYMSENAINDILKSDEMGYKGRLVGHGFRSLASTTLNELGYAPDIIEKQLAHEERNQVRAAYNRAEYLPQRIEMMQGWADHIDGLLTKGTSVENQPVVEHTKHITGGNLWNTSLFACQLSSK